MLRVFLRSVVLGGPHIAAADPRDRGVVRPEIVRRDRPGQESDRSIADGTGARLSNCGSLSRCRLGRTRTAYLRLGERIGIVSELQRRCAPEALPRWLDPRGMQPATCAMDLVGEVPEHRHRDDGDAPQRC